MLFPCVPVQAILQVEQFVIDCIDNGGKAVHIETGTVHLQPDSLLSLQSLLHDLHRVHVPGTFPTSHDCLRARGICALGDLDTAHADTRHPVDSSHTH